MFDSEAAIRSWKRTLLERGTLRAEHADELEDHLRQEMSNLSALPRTGTASVSEEEAFVLAARRLGRTESLAEEFGKSDPGAVWRRRWMWMLGGYIGFGLASTGISLAAALAYSYTRGLSSEISDVLSFAIVLLGLVGLVVLARFVSRSPSAPRLWRMFAGRLVTTKGIVATSLVVLGVKFALVPIGQMLQRLPDGTTVSVRIWPVWYTQLGLWLAPIVALALLAWFERGRIQRESDPSAG